MERYDGYSHYTRTRPYFEGAASLRDGITTFHRGARRTAAQEGWMMADNLKKPLHELLTEQLIERLRQGRVSSERLTPVQAIHEHRMQDWTGSLCVKGVVQDGDATQWADDLGVEPDFYGLYAQKTDNTLQWLCNYRTERQAEDMAKRLAGVFSMLKNSKCDPQGAQIRSE
jgi:hypothetical protein